MEAMWFFVIFALFFGLLIGYLLGDTNRGKLVAHTNELSSNSLFMVISIDRTSAVLEEIEVSRNRFLVSTEIFGGKPIRPKEVVRKIKNYKEIKEQNLPVLGYPPFVKVEEI